MKTQTERHIEIINDWYPETRALLDGLIATGCTILSGDNGEDTFDFNGDFVKFIDDLSATDESHLYVKTPNGKRRWIFLVYGNNPGELPSDYIVDAAIDTAVKAHYDKWELIGQPKKRGFYCHETSKFVTVDATYLPVVS